MKQEIDVVVLKNLKPSLLLLMLKPKWGTILEGVYGLGLDQIGQNGCGMFDVSLVLFCHGNPVGKLRRQMAFRLKQWQITFNFKPLY